MEENKEQRIELGQGSQTTGDLNDACVDIWNDLKKNSEAREALAEALGVSADKLVIEGDCPVEFEDQAAGVGVVTGGIVLIAARYYVAPLMKDITLDLWRAFLLPRLKRKFGKNVVGEAKPEKTP